MKFGSNIYFEKRVILRQKLEFLSHLLFSATAASVLQLLVCYSCCLVKAEAVDLFCLTFKKGWKTSEKRFRPAFGRAQHPKAGRNTQHTTKFRDSMMFNFLNNLLNILMIFKSVLFDDFYSMLLSRLNLNCHSKCHKITYWVG